MNEHLMLQIAGFLKMQATGMVLVEEHVRKEAGELLEKVGQALVDEKKNDNGPF